jgi:cytochrome c
MADPTPPNHLSEEEVAGGWRLLFDGKSFDGWHRYGNQPVGSAWIIEDGAITLVPGDEPDWSEKYGGDIVTDSVFEDFELSLEWKISPGGNSGVFFLVDESPAKENVDYQGLEMQVLDNDLHPDGAEATHRAGDLYDLIEADTVAVRSVGEWNHARIVKDGARVEHWLNGAMLLSFELWTDEWNQLLAGSKFAKSEGYAEGRRGRIALQDHDDRVAYRNIKIRPL